METPNYRKASIYFDDETVLEVTQRGGGGSGVGGETGLEAVNLKTGESTNAALAEKDETIAEQAETIETQAATIETQAATIIELQEELADVPTIEALNVTANGTYSEDGKAYSPVTVNVPAVADESKKLWNAFARYINNAGIDIYGFKTEIAYGEPAADGYYNVGVTDLRIMSGALTIPVGAIGGYYSPTYANARHLDFYAKYPASKIAVSSTAPGWSANVSQMTGELSDFTRVTIRYTSAANIDSSTPGLSAANPAVTFSITA